jgi:uncharacterized membrane protein YfcA
MLAAPLGARASHLVAPRVLMLLFAGLMLGVGALMLCGRSARPAGERAHPLAAAAAGAGVGLLTGFLGIGGGFLVVPALTLLLGLEMHAAVGTSLLVIAANAAAALASHLLQGELPLGLTAAFTAAAALGALAGVRLASGLDPARLRKGFALFVLAIGALVLARSALAP